MADPFVAEIRPFAFSFAPSGWAFCDGQVMPLSQNTALFALLGTTYGGDGKSNFRLPDLRDASPLHVGGNQPGPGLSTYDLGETGGAPHVTLLPSETAPHSHAVQAATQDVADASIPGPSSSFASSTGGTLYQNLPNTTLSGDAVSPSGASLPHNNMPPYLTVTFCIALQGVFPPRS